MEALTRRGIRFNSGIGAICVVASLVLSDWFWLLGTTSCIIGCMVMWRIDP